MKASEARRLATVYNNHYGVLEDIYGIIKVESERGMYQTKIENIISGVHRLTYEYIWKPRLIESGYDLSIDGRNLIIKW